MISCWLAEPLLPALLRGHLSPARAARLQAHLAHCTLCQQRLATYRHALALFEGSQAPLPERSRPALPLAPARPRSGVALPLALGLVASAGMLALLPRPSPLVSSWRAASPRLRRPPSPIALLPRQEGSISASLGLATLRQACIPARWGSPPFGKRRVLEHPRYPLRPSERGSQPKGVGEAGGMQRGPGGSPAADDLLYLNPPITDTALQQREAALLRSVAGGDTFITVVSPPFAAVERGNLPALEAVQREQAVVDVRLTRPLTLAARGIPFSQLCEQLSRETGIAFSANPRVADDEVTLYCTARPLREVMRQLALHFGFEWRRTGAEPQFSYELTQSLGRQLLEESLRQRDRDAMLLKIEEGVKGLQKLFALTPDQQAARIKALEPHLKDDRAAFDEWSHLRLLRQGGQTVLPRFLSLSAEELSQLRGGQTYQWDLMPGGVLPEAVRQQAEAAFLDPSGKPLVPGPIQSLQGTLQLERKEGQWTLRGGFQRDGIGLQLPLATATSPARDKIDNAARNQALVRDPGLQKLIALTLAPTCTLLRHRYPEFDDFDTGPRVIAADALEALHRATGQDIIGDQFLRLSAPLSVENKPLFKVLCAVGDHLRLHWGKSENWITFRTPDFYSARPQQVPARLRERWAATRRKTGTLPLRELAEVGTLPAAALDSSEVAQSMLARYGIEEWPLARQPQARPHLLLLSQLPPEQLTKATSPEGLAYTELRPRLRSQFESLLELAPDRAGPPTLRYARLWVMTGEQASLLLPNPGVTFVYSYDQPVIYNVISPFNGMFGLSEPMYQQRLKR